MREYFLHGGSCLRVKTNHFQKQLPKAFSLLDRKCLKTYRGTVKFPELVLFLVHQHAVELVIFNPSPKWHSTVNHCKKSYSQSKNVSRNSIISYFLSLFGLPNFRSHVHFASSELTEFSCFPFLGAVRG